MIPIASMLKPALLILVPITLGVLARYFEVFEGFLEKLYKLVVILILPALVFGSVAVNRPRGILSFGSVSAIALIGLGATSTVAVVGTYITGRDREKSTEIFINGAFMNYTFLGLAVVHSILGSKGLGIASIYAVTIGIIHLTIGMILTKGSAGEDVTFSEIFVDILSFPAALALLVAMLFVGFNAAVPYGDLAQAGMDRYANVASFLMVLATGYKMRLGGFREHLSSIVSIGAIRFLVCPLATFGAILLFGINQTNPTVGSVALLLSVMPPGVFNIILAERFDLDIETYGSVVFYLTLVSLFVVVPILVHIAIPGFSLI